MRLLMKLRNLSMGAALVLVWFPLAGCMGTTTAVQYKQAPRSDLSGVWDFRTLTPLERPQALAGESRLTEEQATEIENQASQATLESDQPSDGDRGAPPAGANVGAYNSFWFDHGARVSGDYRTALIVDPSDGRLPDLQEGVQLQVGGDELPTDLPVRLRVGGVGTDGPESRGLAERCLLGFSSGPPILPGGYNQNIRIVQTNDHVMVLNEMVHDARIIPVVQRPRLGLDTWMGESHGRWEGPTLVVETSHFNPNLASFSPSFFSSVGNAKDLKLTERFRRLDEDTLQYSFTVDDPSTYTAPFTAVLLMRKSSERVYEFACHEGNYALRNILSGARAAERFASSGSD